VRTLPRAVRRMFFFPGNRREPAPRVGAPWRPSSRLRPVCAASPRRADEGCLPHPAAAHAAPALPGTSAHPTRQVQTAVRMPSAPWRPGRRPRSRPSRWRLRRRPRRRAGWQLAFIRGTRLERPLVTASTASLPARLRRTTSTTTERRWPSGAGRPPRGSRATVRRMHTRGVAYQAVVALSSGTALPGCRPRALAAENSLIGRRTPPLQSGGDVLVL